MIELRRYITQSGIDVIGTWLAKLPDDRTRARIAARLTRIAAENFGDCKPLRSGVWELRVDFGPGYRIYYAIEGKTCVILLCAGDKGSQTRDIARAVDYWNDYKNRTRTP
jgi:putative addiction module killer protein